MTTERRRIRKRSGGGSVENERLVARGIRSLAETWKGSQAGRISARSFLPRLHRARLICPLRAREHAGKNRRQHATRDSRASYAVYITFARCKCVVPHAISWSNGPRSRDSHSHNHAQVLPALVPINTKRIERLSRRRIGSARGGAQDSDERAKY